MKKIYCITMTVILCFFLIYRLSPDYVIADDWSTYSEAGKEVELNVIDYRYWKMDEHVLEIAKEHARVNGTPASLMINMYYSHICLEKGEKFDTVEVHFTGTDPQMQLL